MNNLVVSDITIGLTDGLYSLNDLHKASGGEDRHKPTNFLRLESTAELVGVLTAELDGDAQKRASEQNQAFISDKVVRVVKGGVGQQGTFVCKELVYAYAMWISPAFNLRVIRAFDVLASSHFIPQTYPEALRAYADELEAHEKTKKALETAKLKAEYFDHLVARNLLVNIRDTAKELRVKQNEFVSFLLDNGYLFRDPKGKLRPYAQHTPDLFELKEFTRGEYSDVQTLVTPKGRETFRLLLQVPRLEKK